MFRPLIFREHAQHRTQVDALEIDADRVAAVFLLTGVGDLLTRRRRLRHRRGSGGLRRGGRRLLPLHRGERDGVLVLPVALFSRVRGRPSRRAAGARPRACRLAIALSKSTTTVLRSLRTRCATGCASVMRTRDVGTLSVSTGSTATAAIGLFAFGANELATPSAATFRNSTSTVSESGRVAT